MPTLPVYNSKGEAAGEVTLAEALFAVEPNEPVVHQAVVTFLANQRQGTASTRGRSEVRGGGHKPWRQKGTGRARQGTRTAPHWKGGGVAFGPKPRNYRQALPKRMRELAFACALSDKLASGLVKVVNQLELAEATTRSMAGLLARLEVAGPVLVVMDEPDPVVTQASGNLPGVRLVRADELNTYQVVAAAQLLFTQAALARLEERTR